MKRPLQLLLFALLLVCAASCKSAGRAFGPKDEGGIYLVIAVKADAAQLDQAIAQTVEVMQRRCEYLNIYCKVERGVGDKADRIKLKISTRDDPERVKRVILSQGLELRAVVSPQSPTPVQTYDTQAEAAEAAGADKDVMPYVEDSGARTFIVLERTPVVEGRDVLKAEAVDLTGEGKYYGINFTLRPEGAVKLSEWSGAHINSYLAVVLDKEVRYAAYIKSQISDTGQISGSFTKERAEDTALVLNSGGLPAPIEALEEGVYKP